MRELGSELLKLNGPVLITGHTGFKGAWLTFLLESLGVPVVGFSLPATPDSLYARANRHGKIPEIFGDITLKTEVEKVFNQFIPSCVIHLAAEALVLRSYQSPINTFAVNVLGTANVLEAATSHSSVLISGCVTSDKVYENNNKSQRFVEEDKLAGLDPYSASKVCSEAVISAWRQLSKDRNRSKILSLRAGNVVGGGDFATNRLLPDIVKALYFGEQLVVRNLTSTRPWQHVLDPLLGYLIAIEMALSGQKKEMTSYNFGPIDSSLSVERVLSIASESFPENNLNVTYTKPSVYEEATLELDSSRAKLELGWEPRFSQEEAIKLTFVWWKNHLALGMHAQKLCDSEIQSFLRGGIL